MNDKTFVSDTFADTSGTTLNNHTGETGAWVRQSGKEQA